MCLRKQDYDYVMAIEKYKIKAFSTSVMLGEKYLISKNGKSAFCTERICFGAQIK